MDVLFLYFNCDTSLSRVVLLLGYHCIFYTNTFYDILHFMLFATGIPLMFYMF